MSDELKSHAVAFESFWDEFRLHIPASGTMDDTADSLTDLVVAVNMQTLAIYRSGIAICKALELLATRS